MIKMVAGLFANESRICLIARVGPVFLNPFSGVRRCDLNIAISAF